MGEVVITDLNNYCMPFIRYRIGDLAEAIDRRARCTCGRGAPRLGAIEGRVQSIIQGADGRYLPGTFFAHYLKEFDHAIKKFQVVQEERDAMTFRVVKGGRYSDDVLEEVLATFREYLGEKMKIDVEFVDEVAMVRTGKRLASVSQARHRLPEGGARASSGAAASPGDDGGSRVVVVHRPGLRYADAAPYDPPNPVYEAVEALCASLGLDAARAGTPEWNPLGDLIARRATG